MKHLLIGLHGYGHDSNISFYDLKTNKTHYYKFERRTGNKHHDILNLNLWIEYELPYLGYSVNNILEICSTKPIIAPWLNPDSDKIIKQLLDPLNVSTINHHQAHQYSNFMSTGIVYDGEGNNGECLSIYGQDGCNLKLTNKNHLSLGLVYNKQYESFYPGCKTFLNDGVWETINHQVDYAGKVMAWEAYGDYLLDWHARNKNLNLRSVNDWSNISNMDLSSYENEFKKQATFIRNITLKYAGEIINLCKNFFTEKDYFSFSGGVAQNLILNNYLKSVFPKLELFPHNQDDGLSLGCLYYLIKKHNIDAKVELDNFPFSQSDQDMGYASSQTIKKVAGYLAKGKIILWCQGHGEIGPRALGHRSILMNPLIKDAKEQINNKVKKREWYRPYAASVKFDIYKKYFKLDWESPYMLYQAEVIDKESFKSICHADGTCRIQTVYPKQETYYSLLDEFEKLTGVPVLLNTSCNLPGKPIVGFENQAIDMFKNCKADYLVIGDRIYERDE